MHKRPVLCLNPDFPAPSSYFLLPLPYIVWQSSDLVQLISSTMSKIQWKLHYLIQKKSYNHFSVLLSVVLFLQLSSVARIEFYFIWFSKYSGNLFPNFSTYSMEGGEMNVAY